MPARDEGVLLIDDEPLDSEAMRRMLEVQGFRVYEGKNYDDALRIFDSRPGEIDLLVTDISLPGASGVEIASQLIKRKPDLKVLFVSGYVGAEVIRFYGVSANDIHFLRKPFPATEFISHVEAVLSSSEPMRWLPSSVRNSKTERPNGG